MPIRMLIVSGSYQRYHKSAVSNQLTDAGGGGGRGVTKNLLTCDRGGVLYTMCIL
jgi:hypothetical protein